MVTLFERLRNKKPVSGEAKINNPIDAKPLQRVSIDKLGYRDNNWIITKIVENKISDDVKWTDYHLLDRPVSGEDRSIILRLHSNNSIPGPSSRVCCLLLNVLYDLPYDVSIVDAVNDPTNVFVINDDNGEHRYTRINNISSVHSVTTVTVADKNADKFIDDNEVIRGSLKMWDYTRDYQDDDGKTVTEFLFVELDNVTKRHLLLTGSTILADNISLF